MDSEQRLRELIERSIEEMWTESKNFPTYNPRHLAEARLRSLLEDVTEIGKKKIDELEHKEN